MFSGGVAQKKNACPACLRPWLDFIPSTTRKHFPFSPQGVILSFVTNPALGGGGESSSRTLSTIAPERRSWQGLGVFGRGSPGSKPHA